MPSPPRLPLLLLAVVTAMADAGSPPPTDRVGWRGASPLGQQVSPPLTDVRSGGYTRTGRPSLGVAPGRARLTHRATAFHRRVGQGFILVCPAWVQQVSGGSAWKKNGVPLHGAWHGVGSAASVGRTLVIQRATLGDSGVYTCGDGAQRSMAYIFIHPRLEAPKVQVTPTYVNVSKGKSVELLCSAHGNPQPVIIWNLMERSFSSRVVVDGNTLQIHNAFASDGGTYACVATNKQGEYQEAISTVEVIDQEKGGEMIRTDTGLIAIHPEKFKGPVGSTVILSCNTITGIDSSVQWNRQNGKIPSRATYTKGSRQLIITDAQVNESGLYSCITWHESGEYYVQASAEVSIISGIYLIP